MTQRWTTERLSQAGVTEDLLVDWIDGTLSPAQEQLIASLPDRASLQSYVEQLRLDSRNFRSLPNDSAPAGLAEAVVQSLSAESIGDDVLQTIGRQAAHQGAVPVQIRRVSWTLTGPRFAMAAAAVLAVTAGMYWAATRGTRNPANLLQDNSLAMTDSHTTHEAGSGPTDLFAASSLAGSSKPGIAGNSNLADAATSQDAAPDRVIRGTLEAASEPTATRIASGPSREERAIVPSLAPLAMAKSSSGANPGPTKVRDQARAIELAKAGRLAVRVKTKDTRGLAQLEKQGRSDSTSPWKLRTQVPPAVLAAVIPPAPVIGPMQDGIPSRALAGTQRSSSMIAGMMSFVPAVTFTAEDPMARVRGTYLVEFAGTDKALAAVQATFAGRLHGEFELEELPEPLDLTPSTTPERVLWWTQPASEWAPRVVVPLVVEQG